jgi:hypothetical protein
MRIYTSLNPEYNVNDLNIKNIDILHPVKQIKLCNEWINKDIDIFTFSLFIFNWAELKGIDIIHVETGEIFKNEEHELFYQKPARLLQDLENEAWKEIDED